MLVREEYQQMLLERCKEQKTFILAFGLLEVCLFCGTYVVSGYRLVPSQNLCVSNQVFSLKLLRYSRSLFSLFLRYWNYCSRLKFWFTCQWSDHTHHCITSSPCYTWPRNVQHLPLLFMGFLPGLNKADRMRQIVLGSTASCVTQASKNPPCTHIAYCGQLQESYTEYFFFENYFFALPFSHISA